MSRSRVFRSNGQPEFVSSTRLYNNDGTRVEVYEPQPKPKRKFHAQEVSISLNLHHRFGVMPHQFADKKRVWTLINRYMPVNDDQITGLKHFLKERKRTYKLLMKKETAQDLSRAVA